MDVRLAVADALLADAASLRRLASSLLAADEVDDVVQATCVAALSRPNAGLQHPGLWLRGTVRKLAVRVRRAGARRHARERLAARSEVEPHDPAALAMEAEVVRDVAAAVHALGEPFRAAILLRFWHDLPVDAIARRLGVPRNTVRSRLQRGLARLRERLDRDHGERERWAVPLGTLVPLRTPAAAGALLLTAMVMKTKLWLGAGAALLAAVTIPWLLRESAPSAVPVPDMAAAGVTAPEPAAVVERREAPTTGQPAAEVAAAPFDPTPVQVEPWLARFVVMDEKHQPVADAAITLWTAEKVPGKEPSERLGTEVSHMDHDRHGEPLLTLTSDSSGRASVQLDQKAYFVLATKTGFAIGTDVMLFASQAARIETQLMLRAPLSIRGVVLRVDGSPAAAATVTVRNTRGFSSTVHSGEDGRFEVTVAEDYYQLWAELDGARTFEESTHVRRRTRCEVTLQFPGAFSLEGEVVDAAGQPVAAASVRSWRECHPDPTLRTAPEEERGWTSSGSDGRFRIQVRKLARYQVVASATDSANSEVVWTETTAAEPHPFTRLPLRAFATITGRVRGESGTVLAGRTVTADPVTDLEIAVASSPGRGDVFAQCKSSVTAADGRFALRVQPGAAWDLATWSTGSFVARTARLQNVMPGAQDVEVIVPDAMLARSTVRGRVVRAADDSPVTGFTVWLALLEADRLPSFRTCKPELNGDAFVLPDLPAGCRYVLQVQPDTRLLFGGTTWSPARSDPFTTSASAVTELEMRAPDWGQLPVRILPAEGEDLDGVTCNLSQDIVQNRARSALPPDPEGRVTIKGIPPAIYQLHVSRDYVGICQQEVLVRSGLNPEVVVRLPKQGAPTSGR